MRGPPLTTCDGLCVLGHGRKPGRRVCTSRPGIPWSAPWSIARPGSSANLRVRVPRVEPLDPVGAPGRRFPGIAEVDPLADDLVVAELHDADDHHRLVVVADRVLVDPEVAAAGGPVKLEVLSGRIRGPEPDDVRLAAHALAALRPLQDSVVAVDLRGAGDVVSWSAAGNADVRRVEVRLDHGSGRRFVHRRTSFDHAMLRSARLSHPWKDER